MSHLAYRTHPRGIFSHIREGSEKRRVIHLDRRLSLSLSVLSVARKIHCNRRLYYANAENIALYHERGEIIPLNIYRQTGRRNQDSISKYPSIDPSIVQLRVAIIYSIPRNMRVTWVIYSQARPSDSSLFQGNELLQVSRRHGMQRLSCDVVIT